MHFYINAAADISPHVLCGMPPPPDVATIKLNAVLSVAFTHPFTPTPPQMQVMTTLADALLSGNHCIVEAPTGTGKTAAVATPLLAFQAWLNEMFGHLDPDRVPRIVYVARTLSQLDNTCKEMSTYPYSVLPAAPVAKEHLCMLPRVDGLSRSDQCREACKPLSAEEQERTGRTTNCAFLDEQNKQDLPASRINDYFTGGPLVGRTVEEALDRSHEQGVCAYHVSRDLAQTNGASVVLLTYAQLFDPQLRACNKTDALLKGALVFIDEAHNVPNVCRDAASEQLNFRQLLALRDEGEEMAQVLRGLLSGHRVFSARELEDHAVRGSIKTVETVLLLISHLMRRLTDETRPTSTLKWVADVDGLTETANLDGGAAQSLIVDAVRFALGLAAPQFASPAPAGSPGVRMLALYRLQEACEALQGLGDALRTVDAALNEAGHKSRPGSAANRRPTGRFGSLLSKLGMCVGGKADCFALLLRRLSRRGRELEDQKPAAARDSPLPELYIACLTASVGMARVLELAQCAVFASGTLGSPADFACEIGLRDGRYSAIQTKHHASVKTQLLPVVYKGRSGKFSITKSTMESPSANNLMDEAGVVLVLCVPHIPGGVLIFFGSKTAMRTFLDHWHRSGTLSKLKSLLPIDDALVVDDADDPEQSKANVERYSHFASKPSTNGGPTVLMFAVLRGRASEGTDFKDGLARGVFVLSVPLPPIFDPFVKAKMAYNDKDSALPDGRRWYQSEGVRCAAQAVGRVIRHAGDFGVAVLMDCRYGPPGPGNVSEGVHGLLPQYLKDLISTETSPEALAARLPPFFARCAALPPAAAPSGVKPER